MCNAYGLRAPVHRIAEAFSHLRIPLQFPGGAAPNLPERELIRPTEAAAVVRPAASAGGAAELVALRWGFAPARPKAPPVINFRSEGRRFATGSRALVLASHFFEYTGTRYPKTRWRFTRPVAPAGSAGGGAAAGVLADEVAAGVEDPFAIAGFIRPAAGTDGPRTPAGEPWPESFTMLTTEPGPDVAPIHDRQVVIVARADWAAWLFGPPEAAAALLRPAPAGTLAVARDEGAVG